MAVLRAVQPRAYIATARYIALYLGLPESRRAEYEGKQAGNTQRCA